MEITEEQMSAIEDVMATHSAGFDFDIYGKEDISQEIFLICVKLLSDYTKDKGELFPFLLGASKNKLISLLRTKYGNSNNKNYPDRIAVYQTKDINDNDFHKEYDESLLDYYGDYIKENIAPEFKEDFLRMLEGIRLPYQRKYEILNYIKDSMTNLDNL